MAQPPQQPPYLDWPLDRWKIGIAVLLFLSLAAWRFVDFGTTGSSDGEVLTTASPAVRIANPGALADPTSTPTPDNSTGPAAETVTITETIVVERTVTADTPVAGEEPVDSAEQLPAEATAEPESTETTSPAEIPAPTEPGTDTPTATMTVTVAPTETATPTLTPTPSPSPSPTPTPTPSPTPQPLTLSVIGESDIFLQNSRPLLYGKAPAGAAVSLEIDAARYTVEADDEGHWQFVPPAPLPVGMNWVRASLSGVATTATDGAVSQMLRIAPTARAVDSPLLMSMLVDEALLTNTPVLSGSGPPGWLIYLEREDAADEEREFLGVTVIDLNGRWSWQPERPLPSGEHRIRAVVVDAEGTPLAISQPQRVRIAGNARPLRPPEMIPLFALDAAEATAAGELLIEGLMGTATPSAQLLLYVDGEWIETIRTSDSGEWRYTFSEPIPGRARDVRLVEVDSNGSPLTLSGPLVLPLQGYEQDSPAP